MSSGGNILKLKPGQSGSLIIEGLLVLVLASLIVMSASQTFVYNRRFSEMQVANADLANLQNTVASMLQNPVSAANVLGNNQTYDPVNGSNIVLYEADHTTPFIVPSPNITPNNQFGAESGVNGKKVGTIYVTSLFLGVPITSATTPQIPSWYGYDNPSLNQNFFVPLTITVKTVSGNNIGGANQGINRTIYLTLHTTTPGGGIIDRASSLVFLGTDAQHLPVIPIPICGTGGRLFSFNRLLRCADTICKAGPTPQPVGWQANGDVICGP